MRDSTLAAVVFVGIALMAQVAVWLVGIAAAVWIAKLVWFAI